MIYRNVDQYPNASSIPGILILEIDAPIYFANANYLRERYYYYYCSFLQDPAIHNFTYGLHLISLCIALFIGSRGGLMKRKTS